MNLILRSGDLVGDARNRPTDLEHITLDDLHPMLSGSVELADIIILMPEDCPSVKVLKDVYEEAAQDPKCERDIFPRRPEVLHMILTFGKSGGIDATLKEGSEQ